MQAKEDQLLDFLNTRREYFVVPVYQRNYDWKLSHCERLFNDICKINFEDQESYFIGSVVTIENTRRVNDIRIKEYLIIDGQQRITSIFLLLLACLNQIKLKPISDQERILTELKQLIFNINDQKLKLKSVKGDDAALQKIIENEELIKDSNLTQNYLLFIELINKSNLSIREIIDALEKLQIVNIKLEKDIDDPQLIFESLNSSGLDLSGADLIRNFLLMKQNSVNQEKFYNKYWVKIEENTGFQVTLYIRQYLTVKLKRIPKKSDKEIYSDFKKYVEDQKYSYEEILIDLLKYSKYYNIIAFSNSKSKKVNKWLWKLSKLKVEVSYPFLLFLFDKLHSGKITEETVVEVLEIIESYVFRRMICDVPTNALNKIFMALGYELEHRKFNSIPFTEKVKYSLTRKRLSQRFPDNKEFKNSFQTKEVYSLKPKNRVYILSNLDQFENREKVDIENLLLEKEISIEHIMPQKLNNAWRKMLGDSFERVHEKWIHTIGNLTLTSENSSMGNKAFEDKRNIGFDKSRFLLNDYLKTIDVWDEKHIKERAKLLIEVGLRRWRYPSMNKKYKIDEPGETFYELSHLDHFAGKKLKSFELSGIRFNLMKGHWKEFYEIVTKEFYKLDPSIFRSFIKDPDFKNVKRKMISNKLSDLSNPIIVVDGIYLESGLSSNHICKMIQLIMEKFDWEENELLIYLKDESKK